MSLLAAKKASLRKIGIEGTLKPGICIRKSCLKGANCKLPARHAKCFGRGKDSPTHEFCAICESSAYFVNKIGACEKLVRVVVVGG